MIQEERKIVKRKENKYDSNAKDYYAEFRRFICQSCKDFKVLMDQYIGGTINEK